MSSNPHVKDSVHAVLNDTERFPRQVYLRAQAFYHLRQVPFLQEAPKRTRREALLKTHFPGLRRSQARQSLQEDNEVQ